MDFGYEMLPSFLDGIFHPQTLYDLCSLQHYFSCIQQEGPLDDEDHWVQMLVLTSLGGPRRCWIALCWLDLNLLPSSSIPSPTARPFLNGRLLLASQCSMKFWS